ncbi:hypothetical protein BDZ97DRAFT_1756774 [Flammula alnicola]|nr:hypothetical protein BDZ97DRAFT_1756774 [Flammula alnicola]
MAPLVLPFDKPILSDLNIPDTKEEHASAIFKTIHKLISESQSYETDRETEITDEDKPLLRFIKDIVSALPTEAQEASSSQGVIYENIWKSFEKEPIVVSESINAGAPVPPPVLLQRGEDTPVAVEQIIAPGSNFMSLNRENGYKQKDYEFRIYPTDMPTIGIPLIMTFVPDQPTEPGAPARYPQTFVVDAHGRPTLHSGKFDETKIEALFAGVFTTDKGTLDNNVPQQPPTAVIGDSTCETPNVDDNDDDKSNISAAGESPTSSSGSRIEDGDHSGVQASSSSFQTLSILSRSQVLDLPALESSSIAGTSAMIVDADAELEYVDEPSFGSTIPATTAPAASADVVTSLLPSTSMPAGSPLASSTPPEIYPTPASISSIHRATGESTGRSQQTLVNRRKRPRDSQGEDEEEIRRPTQKMRSADPTSIVPPAVQTQRRSARLAAASASATPSAMAGTQQPPPVSSSTRTSTLLGSSRLGRVFKKAKAAFKKRK